MRKLNLLVLFLFFSAGIPAQKTENLVIITLDGLRWQELFGGMDSAIARNANFHQGDSQYIFDNYWHTDVRERRKRLFPFLWTTIEKKGVIAGNRVKGSRVECANNYWFSFPGYSEIFTGYPDSSIDRNDHPPNPNKTVLEYFQQSSKLKGAVAAFGAWNAFDRILNEKRAGFPVINAFDSTGGKHPNANERLINRMLRDSYRPWLEGECLDVFTHYSALEWLKTRKPKVLYIAYGETDEWAHSGMYRSYLDAARQTDAWIAEIWNWLQMQPQYRNKTNLFITTDHGRGDSTKTEWTSHNRRITGANGIWFAAIGPGIAARGEFIGHPTIYQKQFAQTFAKMMGMVFRADHPVADAIDGIWR